MLVVQWKMRQAVSELMPRLGYLREKVIFKKTACLKFNVMESGDKLTFCPSKIMHTSLFPSRVWLINFTVCIIKYQIYFSYLIFIGWLSYVNTPWCFIFTHSWWNSWGSFLKVHFGDDSHAKLDEAAYSLPCLSS